jgi:hypothetical protein
MARSRRTNGNWIKFSVDFADHPKTIGLSAESCWMYVCGLTYSAKYLTDGRIPRAHLPRLSNVRSAARCTEALISAGLWKWSSCGQSVIIHDYLEWQTAKAEVDEIREKSRLRQEKARQKQAGTEEARHAVVTRDKGVMSRVTNEEVRALEVEIDVEVEVELNTLATDSVDCGRESFVEAIMTVCKLAQTDLTASARGAVNSAVKQLRDAGASPGEIEARAEIYRRLYPDAVLTPSALVKHWPALTQQSIPLTSWERALAELEAEQA